MKKNQSMLELIKNSSDEEIKKIWKYAKAEKKTAIKTNKEWTAVCHLIKLTIKARKETSKNP